MSTIVIKKNLQRVGYAKADKYITSPVRYSTISTEDLLKYASQNSGIPKAQMMAAFYAINQQVEQFILNGHTLQLGTLGYFFLSVKTKVRFGFFTEISQQMKHKLQRGIGRLIFIIVNRSVKMIFALRFIHMFSVQAVTIKKTR